MRRKLAAPYRHYHGRQRQVGEKAAASAFGGASPRHGSHDGAFTPRARYRGKLRHRVRAFHREFFAPAKGTRRLVRFNPQAFCALHARNRGKKSTRPRDRRSVAVSQRRARASRKSAGRFGDVRRQGRKRCARLRLACGNRAGGFACGGKGAARES